MNRKLGLLSLALAVPLISACGGGSDNDDVVEAATAQVRALHASFDAPAVDIRVNGDEVLGDVTFTSASGNIDLAPGMYDVEVLLANTETVVLDETVSLSDGDLFSIIAANKVASIETLLVTEDGSTVTPGFARVNITHASPDAGVVDIYVTTFGADLPVEPTFNDVPFKASAALSSEVPAGSYQVRITGGSSTDIVYDSGELALAGGSNLSVVAVDSGRGDISPVDLVVLTGGDENPLVDDDASFVRVVHGVPATTVDVYVNDALAIEDFAYETVTDYIRLNSSPKLDLTLPDDALMNAVLSETPTLDRGSFFTVIARGIALSANYPLGFLSLEDSLEPSETETNAKLRVVHAAPFGTNDSSADDNVDVYLTGDDVSAMTTSGTTPNLPNVDYLADSGYLEIAAATYTAQVTPTGSTSVAIAAEVDAMAGENYTAIAVGGNHSPLKLLLLEDAALYR